MPERPTLKRETYFQPNERRWVMRMCAIDRAVFDAIVTHGVDPAEMREQVDAAIANAEDEVAALTGKDRA